MVFRSLSWSMIAIFSVKYRVSTRELKVVGTVVSPRRASERKRAPRAAATLVRTTKTAVCSSFPSFRAARDVRYSVRQIESQERLVKSFLP
jgi:hypothetical protein